MALAAHLSAVPLHSGHTRDARMHADVEERLPEAAAAGPSWVVRLQNLGAVAVLLSVFVLIGVMRLPTVPVVLCVAPLSIALAYLAMRSDSGGAA